MVLHMTALFWIIFTLVFTDIASQDIEVEVTNDILHLRCPHKTCEWKYEGDLLNTETNCTLDLGSVWNDPRGTYSCLKNDGSGVSDEKFIDVYVRKCQNCIELDAGTISGFIVADLIMIGLIAVAVYFVSGSETRRPARASDKQNLIDTNSEYQALRHRQNEPYSQLAVHTKRNAT